MLLKWSSMPFEEKRAFIRANLNSSSTEIAAMFQGATRNSVIGFCHRHNLQLGGARQAVRSTSAAKKKAAAPQRRPKPASTKPPESAAVHVMDIFKENKPPPAPAEKIEEVEIPSAPIVYLPVSMLNKTSKQCSWPLNRSYIGLSPEEMMFCGKPVVSADPPYCMGCLKKSVGGVFKNGKVHWNEGEAPAPKKVRKLSAIACRG